MKTLRNIPEAIDYARTHLANTGQVQQVDKWQGIKSPAPMFEAHDLIFQVPMDYAHNHVDCDTGCNQAWAEEHFQERISGIPYNPPPSNERWPYRQNDNAEFKADEKFSHTYPERFWPRSAGGTSGVHVGIRYEYGDLSDVIYQLLKDPTTRQAYLPIWFPEDTGAVSGQRVPCSLGYYFCYRNGFLHMTYTIRSCDYFRHFRDDVYMAIRLAQHVHGALKFKDAPVWNNTQLGYFKMIVFNLHIFAQEEKLLYKK